MKKIFIIIFFLHHLKVTSIHKLKYVYNYLACSCLAVQWCALVDFAERRHVNRRSMIVEIGNVGSRRLVRTVYDTAYNDEQDQYE